MRVEKIVQLNKTKAFKVQLETIVWFPTDAYKPTNATCRYQVTTSNNTVGTALWDGTHWAVDTTKLWGADIVAFAELPRGFSPTIF